ncbi:type I phosphomannose isomerase catalytic subunit [Pelosinus sp. IPA-1]|uniref:type I phosphomannose isomerase catalytic subunit n=1 Tax=Pelosinus sp. IPA-1 TaxID=3029569 RepID=UPI00243624C2|nr:type I phosphomannose isomerase catalytic subunit [Pelosinus sp. IPA-1]GMB01157.1 mannose-6-phosphate isomerase [Pelosinus sp. IPA-1]
MYPLKFTPIYKERIWGGNNLGKVFGRQLPGDCIGESWEISDHDSDTSIVINGNLAGKKLNELMVDFKERLMGKKFKNQNYFPLLIKIIDANDKLSIQVHPEDKYAYQVEGEDGKTEAWYVINAKEDARIVYGLRKNITKADFIKAVESNHIDETLKVEPVVPGDMIFVPAGTVHALLEGVMVYEVQQNSDTTYRVYDYDRVGDDGKKRELHIKKAIEVINFKEQPGCSFKSNSIHCQYFNMEKMMIQGEKIEKTNNQFIIYCVTAGTGEIIYKDTIEFLHAGETVLIPACLDNFKIKGNIELLKIT